MQVDLLGTAQEGQEASQSLNENILGFFSETE